MRLLAPSRPALVRRAALALLGAWLGAACASGGRGATPAARVDRSVITQAQIREGHFTNARDAIEALRGNWLVTRGPDSSGNPSQIWVYYDATRLGGLETLATIAATDIESIRFLDGVAATQRYGVGHAAGVIVVSAFRSR